MSEPEWSLPMNRAELIAHAESLAAELAEQVDANTELVRRDVQSCNGLNVANRRVRELEADRDQISLTLDVAKADRDKWFNRARDLEAVLRTAHAELTDHGHQELGECECRIAYVLGSAKETTVKPDGSLAELRQFAHYIDERLVAVERQMEPDCRRSPVPEYAKPVPPGHCPRCGERLGEGGHHKPDPFPPLI